MNSPLFIISVALDRRAIARTLVDSGCLSYGAISDNFVRRNNLTTIKISPKTLKGVGGEGTITYIVRSSLSIN